MRKIITFGFVLLLPLYQALASLKIVTTTTTLQSIVEQVVGDKAVVSALTKGTQDPHFLEPKPSYVLQLRDADLLISVGLDLEVGWLPELLRTARNPKIQPGQSGFFEAGVHVTPLEVTTGKADRSQGDVHPKGNPHFHLDPLQIKAILKPLVQSLSKLDVENAAAYAKQAEAFAETLNEKLKKWKQRVRDSNVSTVITYHRTLNYFFNRFDLFLVGEIEPKPGVPPSPRHVIELIKAMKAKTVKCILNENYFERAAADRLAQKTGAFVQVVPVEVAGQTEVRSYFDLIESIVLAIEKCGGN